MPHPASATSPTASAAVWGPLGRSTGYAADYVRRLDVVTADGIERTVTADDHPELFWALRGGGGNLAAVTGIEIDLLPIADLYGGGLYFAGDRAPDVLAAFGRCIAFRAGRAEPVDRVRPLSRPAGAARGAAGPVLRAGPRRLPRRRGGRLSGTSPDCAP